ncbi:methyltransferase domain-containing protein [Cryptosporangium arvum]|uniref:methyltransferase domain-containing protein n=1 Tax=Cryptosporangium arvum TaxID=80871 RepID=UPI0004AC57B1|nr:methyltransferase domain-containing protein [Cryptosporangium arvum]
MKRTHAETDALIALLDIGDGIPGGQELRRRSYQLLDLAPGSAVVDVGCGSGRAAAEMSALGVTAVGVDPDERMVAVASERWPAVDYRVATAEELPFGDAELRGYRADKVFHVLDDPARAVDEARRVLAPRGRIVLVGQDWDTIVIDSDDPALTRTIVQAAADRIRGPRVVRRSRNLLLDAGFTDVTVEVHTWIFTGSTMVPMLADLAAKARTGEATSDARTETWIADQRARGEQERLFLALPMFVTAATRRA